MAIDSQPLAPPTGSAGTSSLLETPVIENEIPAYRAISARAVTSVVLGAASVFCFTSLWFLTIVLASVLFGWGALRAIKRLPDMLTGTSLAKTGIGLAAVFGLTATTQVLVQSLMLTYDATQFAKMYTEILKSSSIADAVYYRQSVDYRKEKTPEDAIKELKTAKNPGNPDVYGTETSAIVAIHEAIKKPDASIHFARIESQLVDGLTQYANALLDIDSPGGEQFALIELVKDPTAKFGEWRIRALQFPYKQASTEAKAEKKDDGHGHSH